MARRNLSLFKKTTVEPEVMEEDPALLETETDDGLIPVYYDTGLDEAPPDFIKPLSAAETKRRAELEGLITRNFKSFYDVGCALREIQQRMLYRTTHKRFSDYLKDQWEMARRTAYGYIEAADVVDNVRNCAQNLNVRHGGQSEFVYNCRQNENVRHGAQTEDVHHGGQIEWVPQNERQARALIRFKDDPKALQAVVIEAVQTAPEGKITASHIKRTAKRLHLENIQKTVKTTKKRTRQAPKISPGFRQAFENFLDAINEERANAYRDTDCNEVIRHVHIILEALEAEL